MCEDLADVFGSWIPGGVLSGVQHGFFSVHHLVHPTSDSLVMLSCRCCSSARFSVDEIKVLKRNYEEGKQKADKARPRGIRGPWATGPLGRQKSSDRTIPQKQ
jgi:hypothetical protein